MREQRDTMAEPAADARETAPDKRGTTILRDTGRVEAFSDGVFAVAATLLVLNLQPPVVDATHTFASGLLKLVPKLVAYLISFGFILIMWINHHNMFRVIRGTDHNFLLLNGLLLLLVTLVPFTTALLPAYGTLSLLGPTFTQSIAAALYSANYLFIAFAYNFMWRYSTWHGRLLNDDVDVQAVTTINWSFRLGPLSYLICVALAFVSVPASLALNVALAVFYAWPHRARLPQANYPEDRPDTSS